MAGQYEESEVVENYDRSRVRLVMQQESLIAGRMGEGVSYQWQPPFIA